MTWGVILGLALSLALVLLAACTVREMDGFRTAALVAKHYNAKEIEQVPGVVSLHAWGSSTRTYGEPFVTFGAEIEDGLSPETQSTIEPSVLRIVRAELLRLGWKHGLPDEITLITTSYLDRAGRSAFRVHRVFFQ